MEISGIFVYKLILNKGVKLFNIIEIMNLICLVINYIFIVSRMKFIL